VPFAAVAVIILLGTLALGALVANMEDNIADQIGIERAAVASIERSIMDHALVTVGSCLEAGFRDGRDQETISKELDPAFVQGFEGTIVLEGWDIGLHDVVLGLDLSTPFPTGRVVGHVNWSAISPDGTRYRTMTRISEELDRPFGLVAYADDVIQLSGNEGGDLSDLVRSMLFKMAIVRVGNGELEGSNIITSKDVGMALEMALDMFLNITDDGDPADSFLELIDETEVRSSVIISQYLMGLLDYYLLWFRDYTGIGEGSERFFEWIGEWLAKEGEDIEDVMIEEDFEEWWRSFNVRDAVERWAFGIMASAIRTVLEMYDDDDIDIRDMDLGEMADVIRGGTDTVNGVAVDVEDLRPVELERSDDGLVPVLGRVLLDVALEAMEGLVDCARELAAGSIEDLATVDEVHGISAQVRDWSVPKGAVNSSRFSVLDLTVQRSELDVDGSISVKGSHHTAPEEKLAKALDGLMHPGEGRAFREIRPYEADFKIRIEGNFTIFSLIVMGRDLTTLLVSNDVVELKRVVPIDIWVTVPVFTGVPLKGVDYDPTDTFVGDLKEIVWEFVNRTWAGLQWIAGSMSRLMAGAQEGLRELGTRGLDNLGKMSARAFSRTVEDVLGAMYERAWNDAVNITWRFIRNLIGEDLKEMLTFELSLFGFELTISIDLFAETLEIGHSSDRWGFYISITRLAEDVPPFRPMPVDGFRYALIGLGHLNVGRFSVEGVVDPLTIVNPFVVSLIGELRNRKGKGFRFELHGPLAYKVLERKELRLSSLIGVPISGLPVPGTGLTADIDAGLRILHGKGVRSPDKLLIRAIRSAWYDTLKGYTVKELYGDLGDPELLEAFFVQLLNNIVNSIGDTAAKELPEMELFVEGELKTVGGVASGGFSLSFVIKDPVHVLLEIIPWFVDNLRSFLLGMTEPGLPSGLVGLSSYVTEHLFVRGMVYVEAGAPDIVGGKDAGRIKVGGLVEANLPALGALVGVDRGRWMVHAGIVLPGIPSAIASTIPGFRAPRPKCDLWMVELKIMELDNDRAKITEVYYDTDGSDVDEEYIEIWNPTGRRIDMSRWVLNDNGGRWRLPEHLSVPPGARVVIARDRDGFRGSFGSLPDVSGLPLSLNNDGDVIRLSDPYGVEIDSVSWENHVHGWDLVCETGEALHRDGDDTDSPGDWYCDDPDPGR